MYIVAIDSCVGLSSVRNDWWLPCGIAGFIAGLFCRKISGSTEYQHWVMEVHHSTYIHYIHGCVQC